MPSIYNKMQPIGGTASSTTKEQTTMPHSENFPGGLWINGVRVDVAGRIAPKSAAQSKDTAEARQPAKQGPAAVDLFAMD